MKILQILKCTYWKSWNEHYGREHIEAEVLKFDHWSQCVECIEGKVLKLKHWGESIEINMLELKYWGQSIEVERLFEMKKS